MAEIINLRMARKRKARAEGEKNAADNRLKFGQTKAVREKNKAETARKTKHLDGHKLTD